MIAPLRPLPSQRPHAERRRSRQLRRARHWVFANFLSSTEPESDAPTKSGRAWAAAVWMVGIAAAWVGYMAASYCGLR